MRAADSVAFASVLLAVFLLALALPLAFAFYYYQSIAVAATAALFAVPIFFVYIAAIMLALKRKKAAVVAKPKEMSVRYPWEGMFGVEGREELMEGLGEGLREGLGAVPVRTRAVPAVPKVNAAALAVVALVIAATVIFAVFFAPKVKEIILGGNLSLNVTYDATYNATNAALNITEKREWPYEREDVLSQLLRRNLTGLNATRAAAKAAAAKPAEKPAKPKDEVKKSFASEFASVIASVKNKVAAPIAASGTAAVGKAKGLKAFWPYAAVVIGALILLGCLFYVFRARKLGVLASWAAWPKRNMRKLLVIVAVVAVAVVAIAAFVFRRWLGSKASGMVGFGVDFLSAAKDFAAAYRLYILIGIVALIVILGILFALERRE